MHALSDDLPADARLRDFHALYRREFAFVWATARRLGVPPPAVEDAVQDVFVTAYRRLDHLTFEVSARAWLYGVTRRIAARYRRTAFRIARRAAAVADTTRDREPPPQDRLVAAQQVEHLLERLGPRTRAAFEMAELLGMSGAEIAAELGLPVRTVYSRVRLAREQLLRELDAQQLERGLRAVRDEDDPPQAAAQRAWIALLPGLSTAGAATGLGALASARAAAMTLLVGAGVVVAVALPRTPAPAPAPSAPPAPEVVVAEARSAAPTTPSAAPAPAPAPAPAETRARARAPLSDRLAAEVALLDRARAELARGDADAARALLVEHVRRFPDAALVDLRAATEVEVMCLEGRAAEAAAKAAELVAAFPRSTVAQRFDDFFCER